MNNNFPIFNILNNLDFANQNVWNCTKSRDAEVIRVFRLLGIMDKHQQDASISIISVTLSNCRSSFSIMYEPPDSYIDVVVEIPVYLFDPFVTEDKVNNFIKSRNNTEKDDQIYVLEARVRDIQNEISRLKIEKLK